MTDGDAPPPALLRPPPSVRPLRLLTLAPGHPDAALLQARMVDGVHPRCHVYAPLGADLLAHLGRLTASNDRPVAPTAWAVDVRAGADWRDRALREQPGNVAVIAGRPAQTLDLMLDCVRAGLHVVAAGPWALTTADLPRLAEVYHQAELRELVVWPLSAGRFDPAVQLLLALVADPDVCGGLLSGTADQPAVLLDATRHLATGRSPAWMFDRSATGDALAAAGPLADLALRLVLPGRAPDPARDVTGVDGTGWPGLLAREQFAAVTGLSDFPTDLAPQVSRGTLAYPANGTATFALNGVAVRMSVLAEGDSPPGGGDAVEAVVRGRRATLAARGGAGPGEVTVTPAADAGPVYAALTRCCQGLQDRFPGLSVQDLGGCFRLATPPAGDAGYTAALNEMVRYFRSPRQVPAWERAAALTAAHLTTAACESARRKQMPGADC